MTRATPTPAATPDPLPVRVDGLGKGGKWEGRAGKRERRSARGGAGGTDSEPPIGSKRRCLLDFGAVPVS